MSAQEPVINSKRGAQENMQRLKFITLALVAAFAISAVAVASASAGPEWKSGGGGLGAKKIKFEGSSGAGTLEQDGGTKVKCSSDKAEGIAEGEKAVSGVKVTFEGCKGPFGEECGVAGKVTSELLTGELVYLKATKLEKLGLLLKGTGGAKVFAAFTCGIFETKVTVTGELIGEVTPVNSEAETGTLKYKCCAPVPPQEGKGEQEWDEIEEKAQEITLESEIGGAKKESAIETEDTIKWLPAGTKVGAFT